MCATILDDMKITFGSMVQIPDPLHGGAYPSLTVYEYRHDEDRVRLQLNDTGVLYMYLSSSSRRTSRSRPARATRTPRQAVVMPGR